MKTLMTKSMLAVVLGALSLLATSRAMAEQWPFVQGNYWDVTGIEIKDGGALNYANFLAGQWRKDQEFAKSKGWIKEYMVLSNPYAREGEADLYLVTITDRLPSGAESETRNDEYMAWSKATLADMEKAAGNRAEFRKILSNSLLQELKFR